MVISAAISKHIYISSNATFTPDYFLKYSALERVERAADIEHPIVREALLAHGIEPSVEIVSMADIPAGTGLGSSGAFTVGLLQAIYAMKRDHVGAAKSPRRPAISRSSAWVGRWGSRTSTWPRSVASRPTTSSRTAR